MGFGHRAVAEQLEWQGHDRAIGRGTLLEYVATDSRDAAIKAGQELTRKYAHLFSDKFGVRVDIHPEIEWQPPGD